MPDLLPPPYPPGFEPPQFHPWLYLLGVLFVCLWFLAGLGLAALQLARAQKQKQHNSGGSRAAKESLEGSHSKNREGMHLR